MPIDRSKKLEILKEKNPQLTSMLKSCQLCLRRCGVDRTVGEKGYCGSGSCAEVYTYSPHFGEEPPISGTWGSGTIFFSRCVMSCVYCQNWQFSQKGEGAEFSTDKLARVMLALQSDGCHNINLVSPTHYMPQIALALQQALENGLSIPVVYNTGGYDSPELIELLEGIVDVYLPDMRYSVDEMAVKYSNARGYVENNRRIIKEMHRQTGSLRVVNNVAEKGIIIRLLVLPCGISGTENSLDFIAEEIGKDTFLSVMSQYYPAHDAKKFCEISTRLSGEVYESVLAKVTGLGLSNGWIQQLDEYFDDKFAGEKFLPRDDV